VYHPQVVRGVEPVRNIRADLEDLLDGQLALTQNNAFEIWAIHKFHHNEVLAVFLADIVDVDNAWVAQVSRSLGFMTEALQKIDIVRMMRMQYFDCHQTIQPGVPTTKDGSHTAIAEFFFNFVALVENFGLHIASILNQIVVVSRG
jgi:hypothetical protein